MRFKKIFSMLLTGIMIVSMHGAVFASSTEEQIADVQAPVCARLPGPYPKSPSEDRTGKYRYGM